ncbi:uncharacterized protein [Ptychodera flava]|uniref:uncharacterized protein n=1 Tax=Ptychodera flava TaxID=63121 RepID=UPI00396A8853
MPNARILSPNDPRIKDSEKYKEWKVKKEQQLAAERKKERERREAEQKHMEEVAEQRKLDFEYYEMVRDFELLVEHLAAKATDIAERRAKARAEKERKSAAEETMKHWQAKKREEGRKERQKQQKDKTIEDYLAKSELLQALRNNHQKVMDESWNFQKWFEHEMQLREHNITRYMDDNARSRSSSSRKKERISASAATARTKDGFCTSWEDDQKMISKLRKTVTTHSKNNKTICGHSSDDRSEAGSLKNSSTEGSSGHEEPPDPGSSKDSVSENTQSSQCSGEQSDSNSFKN